MIIGGWLCYEAINSHEHWATSAHGREAFPGKTSRLNNERYERCSRAPWGEWIAAGQFYDCGNAEQVGK